MVTITICNNISAIMHKACLMSVSVLTPGVSTFNNKNPRKISEENEENLTFFN